jgi:hypothetical protein
MRAFRCDVLLQFSEATCHVVWRNKCAVRSLVLDGGK